MERHNHKFINEEWPYPLRITDTHVGKALLYDNVLCYRGDHDDGYGVRRQPTTIKVITAVPRSNPNVASNETYLQEEDREYMYGTLCAIIEAAMLTFLSSLTSDAQRPIIRSMKWRP